MNTADSRVQLSFDIAASATLDEVQRERVLRRLRPRLTGCVLTVVAAEFRSQRLNRVAAREGWRRCSVKRWLRLRQPRRGTRPTRSSIDRRLTNKRRRGRPSAPVRGPGTNRVT